MHWFYIYVLLLHVFYANTMRNGNYCAIWKLFRFFSREYNAIWCSAKSQSLRIWSHHSFFRPNKPISCERFKNWIFGNWMSISVADKQCSISVDCSIRKYFFCNIPCFLIEATHSMPMGKPMFEEFKRRNQR